MDRSFGENGGRVLQQLKTGGVTLIPGTTIPAAVAMEWPRANREALERTKFVEWAQPLVITTEMPNEAVARPAAPASRKKRGS